MQGLATTFHLLTKTENEAALRVLLPALDSPREAIQEGALTALLNRRNPAGTKEILRRVAGMSPRWRSIIRQHHGRMTGALRDAVTGGDATMCRNGCQAAVWFREYDLIPTLLTVLQDPNSPHADMAAEALLSLLESLYEELAGTRDRSDRRDPQMIRRFVVGSLEPAVQRFGQHKRREVIEAFLMLVGRDNAVLKQLLQSPQLPAAAAMMEAMTRSRRRGVIRLLLSFLDDPHAPAAALQVIAARADLDFIQYLLRKIGHEPSPAVAQNLKRIDSIAWLHGGEAPWRQLDDAAQHALVRLAVAANIPRMQVFGVLESVLRHGNAGGRREAARALADFHGAEANALALKALEDPDPQVQAHIVAQLRSRGIPGVLPGLVGMVDSPHAVIRKAAQESLAEFSFRRFLGAFDLLDDEVRQSTGLLVKKIDPQTGPLLREELHSPVRTRRLRALAIARADRHRRPAGGADRRDVGGRGPHGAHGGGGGLGPQRGEASRLALERALDDTSEAVRQAPSEACKSAPRGRRRRGEKARRARERNDARPLQPQPVVRPAKPLGQSQRFVQGPLQRHRQGRHGDGAADTCGRCRVGVAAFAVPRRPGAPPGVQQPAAAVPRLVPGPAAAAGRTAGCSGGLPAHGD